MRWAAAGLAFGLVTAAQTACADIRVTARYAAPTDRYRYFALGRAHEFGALFVTVRRGADPRVTYKIALPPDMVFEDTAPRVVDLDADGVPEILVIQSHRQFGSRLVVLQLAGGVPVQSAASPFVGAPNHWLSVIGAGDLDGDGRSEIALIDAPHRLGQLVIYRYADGGLRELSRGQHVTNHRFGAHEILGGVRRCSPSTEMIVARFDWSELLALRLGADGAITARSLGRDTSPAAFDAALACRI